MLLRLLFVVMLFIPFAVSAEEFQPDNGPPNEMKGSVNKTLTYRSDVEPGAGTLKTFVWEIKNDLEGRHLVAKWISGNRTLIEARLKPGRIFMSDTDTGMPYQVDEKAEIQHGNKYENRKESPVYVAQRKEQPAKGVEDLPPLSSQVRIGSSAESNGIMFVSFVEGYNVHLFAQSLTGESQRFTIRNMRAVPDKELPSWETSGGAFVAGSRLYDGDRRSVAKQVLGMSAKLPKPYVHSFRAESGVKESVATLVFYDSESDEVVSSSPINIYLPVK